MPQPRLCSFDPGFVDYLATTGIPLADALRPAHRRSECRHAGHGRRGLLADERGDPLTARRLRLDNSALSQRLLLLAL